MAGGQASDCGVNGAVATFPALPYRKGSIYRHATAVTAGLLTLWLLWSLPRHYTAVTLALRVDSAVLMPTRVVV